MGNQIIRQPDGKYAVFSRVSDQLVMWDATEDEVIEYFAEEAAEATRRDVRRKLEHVAAGEPERAYHQFAMTWEEALRKDREHGGEAWAQPSASSAARST
ncbi:hypothetical protein GCM10023196_036550 [Actinoallomurus vinaceus]|uniref:Uncharacterized protein n=1 Tax=Actinoallomurus vinaceus TaxID=1080074 RepID=A0ABP8U945_9ACTN